MRRLRELLARLTGMFTKHAHDAELQDELNAHVEMATAENVRRGMPPVEARRLALLEAGGVTQAAEAARDQRGLPAIESLYADMRYAVRALRQNLGFTAVVAVTLALGIGANTAIFSVVRGVLLKPLPHRDGDRLVYLRQSDEIAGGSSLQFSVPEVRDLRQGAPSFAGIAEYSPWSVIYQAPDGAERIRVGLVTGNYFEVMGLSPALGRLTIADDDGPGAAPVVVLTHQFWVKRFGADPDVLGTQMRLDGQPATVIGVVQAAPFFPDPVEVLGNMVLSEHHLSASMVEGRTHRMTEVVARLREDAGVDRARQEVAHVQALVHREFSDAYAETARHRVAVLPFREAMGERARLTLWLLVGAAAFVLIISAANVANLTLMRGVRREHELVVRAALGAGTARLRRLLLAENLVLVGMGAILGLAMAVGGLRLLTALTARYSPRAEEIALDATVLTFAFTLSLGLALLLGMLVALPREGSVASAIGAGARRMTGGLRRQRLQRGLVVVQVAVSVMLLAGAGLLTRTMLRIANVETGLRTEEVLTMEVALLTPTEMLSNPGAVGAARERYEQMRRELAALPGVMEVGVGAPMPLRSTSARFGVKGEGKSLATGETWPRAEFRIASPEFLRAAGVPLLEGREFTSTDRAGSGMVVIINEALSQRLFPNEDPLGKRVAWTGDVLRFTPISPDWRTVVGVVRNTQDGGLDAEPRAAMYVPFAQAVPMAAGFAIRAERDAAALSGPATRVIRRHAPTAPIENMMTIAQYKDLSVAPRRLNAALLSSFGLLAVVIAAVGIAGVLAFSVSARTTEIGIRMSLGADSRRVQGMILGEGGTLVGLGLVLGLAGAFGATRAIEGLLFGVEPHDPLTFAGVAAAMAVVGVVSCWIPALRAARVDPAISMRA